MEDPVCHTYVPVSQAYKKEISGKHYYFCSKQCSEKYTVDKNN
ncbi:MAG: YHS domain-containing protein [Smithella sp.]